jgi:hypothetical protein
MDSYAASLKVLKRIMDLSMEELKIEAAIDEGEKSVLHFAAKRCFPFDAIARLIEAVGIDAQNRHSETVVLSSAEWEHHDLPNELANMKADLSIVNGRGENIFKHVDESRGRYSSDEEKAKVLEVLALHGVTSTNITKGFRSILHDSVSIAEPKRLAEEADSVRFYLRAMSLTIEELKVEAKERDKDGGYPLIIAAQPEGMNAAIERLREAWPSSVDAHSNNKLGGSKCNHGSCVVGQPR